MEEQNHNAVKNAIEGIYMPLESKPPLANTDVTQSNEVDSSNTSTASKTKSMTVSSLIATRFASKKKSPEGTVYSLDFTIILSDYEIGSFNEVAKHKLISTTMDALKLGELDGVAVEITSISAGSVIVGLHVTGLDTDKVASEVTKKIRNDLSKALENNGFGSIEVSAARKGVTVKKLTATKVEAQTESYSQSGPSAPSVANPASKPTEHQSAQGNESVSSMDTEEVNTSTSTKIDGYSNDFESYVSKLSVQEQRWHEIRHTRVLHTEFFWIEDTESFATEGTLIMLKELARSFGRAIPFPG
jgi:hypothetical protein